MASFKLVLAFDMHVGHNYGQHFFMNIDSGYSVGRSASFWLSGERAASTLIKVAGYYLRREIMPIYSLNMHAPDQTI